MPTTLAGLLIFIVLLLPGFVFLGVFTWDRPRRSLTMLQETATVALASTTANLLTLVGFATIRRNVPDLLGLDLDRLVQETGDYTRQHYAQVFTAAVTLLVASCVLSAIVGAVVRLAPVRPALMSSWWLLFQRRNPGTEKTIRCLLSDGSWVQGKLGDWPTAEDESPDRDLVLAAPLGYRAPGESEIYGHPASGVCISARNIVALFVWYSDPTSLVEAGEAVEVEPSAGPPQSDDHAARRPDQVSVRESAQPPQPPSQIAHVQAAVHRPLGHPASGEGSTDETGTDG